MPLACTEPHLKCGVAPAVPFALRLVIVSLHVAPKAGGYTPSTPTMFALLASMRSALSD